jgi:hypothetical protein
MMVSADEIRWVAFSAPLTLSALPAPPVRTSSRPAAHFDAVARRQTCEDLVIADLADSEAAAVAQLSELTEAQASLNAAYESQRETLHVSVGMLALTTYERDQIRSSVFRMRTHVGLLEKQIVGLGAVPVKWAAAA